MKSEMRESAKRAGWWLLLAFVLLSIGSMCSYLYPYQNRVDQNCFFTVGKGMMTGLVPYRDLFEQKGPLLYFLHGLAYLVSPDSFIGVFGLEVASMTLWFVYLYKLARLYTTPRPAMLLVSAAGVLTVVANCFLRGDNAEEFCLPLLTIGLYHLLLFARRNDGRMAPGLLFLNGLLAGCVLWIKYSMLGFWIAWIGMVFLSVWNRRPHREAARALCLFAAGGVAATLPWILYFGWHHAIGDWFYTYFYTNIFLYAKETGYLGRCLQYLCFAVMNTALDPLMMVLIALGLWHFLRGERFTLQERFALLFPFVALYAGCYVGGVFYDYYLLIFTPYCLFGLLFLWGRYGERVRSWWRRWGKRAPAALLAGALVVTILGGNCLLFYGKKREDYPQYQFAQIIRQTPEATLLNYGFLDGGFYLAAGVMPTTKYFCQLNIPEEVLPEIPRTHQRMIENGETDYVVARLGIGQSSDEVPCAALYRNYRVAAEGTNLRDRYRYVLFKRKDLA